MYLFSLFRVRQYFYLPRIVSEPDSKVLNFHWFLFSDFFNTDNLAGSFLEFPQLTQEIPKSESLRKTRQNSNSKQGDIRFKACLTILCM